MDNTPMIASSINESSDHCEMDCIEFNIVQTDTINFNKEIITENNIEKEEKVTEGPTTALKEIKIMSKLAIPVCLTSISRVIMWNTDMTFLGHLGTKQLAGAAMADTVMEILTFFVYSPAWSLNALSSQALGSGNKIMAGYWLQITIIICTLLTLPIYIGYFFVSDLIKLFNNNDDVIEYTQLFAYYSTLYLWPFAMTAVIRIFHESLEIVQPFTYISILSIILNILGNYLWIKYFGFIGSPLATATSSIIQLILYYLWCFKIKKYHIKTKIWPINTGWSLKETIFHYKRMKQFAKIIIPNMISNASENWAYQVIILYAATLEPSEIAALSCMFAVWGILWSFYSGVGCATITRVGKKIGAGNISEAKLVAKISLFLSFLSCSFIAIIVFSLKHYISLMYSSDILVQNIMKECIPYLCCLYTIGGIGWCGGNILESMSKNKSKGFVNVSTAWLGYVPGSLYLGFYNNKLLNISPVSCIFVVGILVEFIRASSLWIIVFKTNWKKASIEAKKRNEEYDELSSNKSEDDINTENAYKNIIANYIDLDELNKNKNKNENENVNDKIKNDDDNNLQSVLLDSSINKAALAV